MLLSCPSDYLLLLPSLLVVPYLLFFHPVAEIKTEKTTEDHYADILAIGVLLLLAVFLLFGVAFVVVVIVIVAIIICVARQITAIVAAAARVV